MSVEERLAKLESEALAWRCVAIGLALVLAIAIVAAFVNSTPDTSPWKIHETLRTKKLEIVNDAGERVGFFHFFGDGAEFGLAAQDGTCQASLTCLRDNAMLKLADTQLEFTCLPGYADWSTLDPEWVAFQEEKRKGSFTPQGLASIEEKWKDVPKSKKTVVVTRGENDAGMVIVYNRNEKVAAALSTLQTNQGVVYACNALGQIKNSIAGD